MAVLPGRNYEVIVLSRWPKGGVQNETVEFLGKVSV